MAKYFLVTLFSFFFLFAGAQRGKKIKSPIYLKSIGFGGEGGVAMQNEVHDYSAFWFYSQNFFLQATIGFPKNELSFHVLHYLGTETKDSPISLNRTTGVQFNFNHALNEDIGESFSGRDEMMRFGLTGYLKLQYLKELNLGRGYSEALVEANRLTMCLGGGVFLESTRTGLTKKGNGFLFNLTIGIMNYKIGVYEQYLTTFQYFSGITPCLNFSVAYRFNLRSPFEQDDSKK